MENAGEVQLQHANAHGKKEVVCGWLGQCFLKGRKSCFYDVYDVFIFIIIFIFIREQAPFPCDGFVVRINPFPAMVVTEYTDDPLDKGNGLAMRLISNQIQHVH